MEGNNFSIYIGICVEDRALKTRLLKCQLIEITPMMMGELADHTNLESFKFEDMIAKAEISSNVNSTNVIVADWFGLFSNRSYPPDVVRGEQLLVFRYGDNDKFYWMSMGRDDNLRLGEILRLAVSDDMSIVKHLNDDNTYFIELDTRVTKRLRLVTSKSDGETYRYNLTFDAKASRVTLGDDDGNQVDIYSEIPRIKSVNRDGTTVDLNKENLIMLAPNDMLLRATNTMTLKATTINILADTINEKADLINIEGTETNITGETINVTGSTDINVLGGAILITGISVGIVSASTSFGSGGAGPAQVGVTGYFAVEGGIEITEDLSVDGNLGIVGEVSIGGNVSVGGNVSIAGNISASNL